MRRYVALVIVGLLVGCSETSPRATRIAATPAPTAALDPATVVRLVRENIAELYATAPQPSWYRYLHMVAGKADVAYDDRWVTVGATLSKSQVTIAEEMCADIAAAAYDADGKPIGFTDVLIVNAKDTLTDCDVPSR
jgi:hypothetical protein